MPRGPAGPVLVPLMQALVIALCCKLPVLLTLSTTQEGKRLSLKGMTPAEQ
jgi:hypothetical protein